MTNDIQNDNINAIQFNIILNVISIPFVCHSYVIVCHSYVIRMSLRDHPYVARTSSVCHSYVLVCHPNVTCMHSYVIRMSLTCTRCRPYVTRMLSRMSPTCHSYVLVCHSYVLVCTRKSSVCHSYVLVCHPHVTRMYSLVICMSLVCSFTMNPIKHFGLFFF